MPGGMYEPQGGVDSSTLPESIRIRRRIAQAMIERGQDFSPIGHWTQGGARVLSALGGNMQLNRMDEREKADNTAFGKLIADTLAPGAAPPGRAPGTTPPVPPSTPSGPAAPPATTPPAGPPGSRIAMAMAPPRPSVAPEAAAGPEAGWGGQQPIASGPTKASTTPNDPFDFARSDPRYRDARQPGRPGAGALDPSAINVVVLHDFGSRRPGGRSPYHLAVRPDGTIVESYGPADRAPHAYNFNGRGYGVSYDGPVGSQPTPEAMASLRFLAQGLQRHNPGYNFRSHGEAYRDTRGTPIQASRLGRGLDEASWRSRLFPQGGQPPAVPEVAADPAAAAVPPVPLAERSMVAGHPDANVSRETFQEDGSLLPGGMTLPPLPSAGAKNVPPFESMPGGRIPTEAVPPQVAQPPQPTQPQPAPGIEVDQGPPGANVPLPPGFNADTIAGPPGATPAADRQPAGPGGQPPPGGPPEAPAGMVDNAQIRRLLQSGNPRAIQLGVALWQANQQAARTPQYDFMAVGDQLYRTNKRTGSVEVVPGAVKQGNHFTFHQQDGNAYTLDQRTGKVERVAGDGQGRPPEAIRTQAIKADQAYQILSRELDNYAALIQRTGISALPGRDKDALLQSRRFIQLQLKELMNLGVLAGPDMQIMEEMLYDPTVGMSWTGPRGLGNLSGDTGARARASITKLKDMLRGMRNTAVAPINLPPIEGTTPAPQGGRQGMPPVGTRRTLGGRNYIRDDSSPSGWVQE